MQRLAADDKGAKNAANYYEQKYLKNYITQNSDISTDENCERNIYIMSPGNMHAPASTKNDHVATKNGTFSQTIKLKWHIFYLQLSHGATWIIMDFKQDIVVLALCPKFKKLKLEPRHLKNGIIYKQRAITSEGIGNYVDHHRTQERHLGT